MPVSVVCETAANVNAALRDSLGGACSAAAEDSKAGTLTGSTADDCLQSKLVASTKRVLLTKMEYDEVNNFSHTVLDTLKSKYIVLKQNQNGAENGRASPGTCNNNGQMNGTNNSHCDANGNSPAVANTVNNNNNNNSPTKRSNPTELPQPKRVLYARENVRIGWKNPARKWQVGVGMTNIGNTCYLNSTLQALFHVPSMANWLMSDMQHMEQCETSDAGCIICAMIKTLKESQCSQMPIRPYSVYSKLRTICKHLVVGRQEDAHEFLRYLVEAMEKSYLLRIRNYKELDQYSKETTPLNQILGGYLKSAVRCLACGHVSVTFQHFQDLLLDIRKADTIEEALDGYFSRERLEDMGYKCESCKKKVSATKQFSLERAPIALCIQLKRFSMLGTKLNKQIALKPRLDLTKFASRKNTGEQLTYKLVAMVTHLGASQHCGHYTAIGLTESGTYYNYDDSYVRPISVQNVCNTNAYIIFYEMDNTPPRQVTSTQVSGADAKENYQKTNGYVSNVNKNVSPQRIIGPQLPPSGLSSYTSNLNGSKMSTFNGVNGNKLGNKPSASLASNGSNNSKITIHFKNNNTPTKSSASSSITTATAMSTFRNGHSGPSTQNGLHPGTGKFQEPSHSKSALACTSNKEQIAAVSNGNESSWSSDNEDGVSSSTHFDNELNSSTNPHCPLPSMPKLTDNGYYEGSQQLNRLHGKQPSSFASTAAVKSLVPYESESDDDNSSVDSKRNTMAKEKEINPLKRRNNSSNTSDDSDNEDGSGKPTNGVKVKKAGTTTSSALSSLSHGKNGATTNNSSPQSKCKQKTDATIDEIFSFHKHANKNHNYNGNSINNITSTATKKQKSQSPLNGVPSSTVECDNNSTDDDVDTYKRVDKHRTHTTHATQFKRANSTPPSPPAIETKTGIWQVTTLYPAASAGANPPEQKVSKVVNNPFATQTPESTLQRHKSNSNDLRTEKAEKRVSFQGNGYQRDACGESAVHELLKQSHRGYGTPVLTWTGQQPEIEKEISAEKRDQRQRDWKDEEENEMDRGRQKKVKSYKDTAQCNSNRTPDYNPFQEHDNQRRWKPNGHRFYAVHYRHQFQRNKFRFHRFNHKLQRGQHQQRSHNHSSSNNTASNCYSRRDS